MLVIEQNEVKEIKIIKNIWSTEEDNQIILSFCQSLIKYDKFFIVSYCLLSFTLPQKYQISSFL